MNKPRALLLANTTHPTQNVLDHIHGMISDERITWQVINPLEYRLIDIDFLNQFQAVGLHYSIRPHAPYMPYFLSKKTYQALKNYSGLIFQSLQDEYAHVLQAQRAMKELNVTLLFSLLLEEQLDIAYPDFPNMKKTPILTGYVEKHLLSLSPPPQRERSIDIFYRSRECPPWFGKLGFEKVYIAKEVEKRAQTHQLHLDISVQEQDRIYGDNWYQALQSAKAVLGTESGSSIWDKNGSIQRQCQMFMRKNPQATFDDIYQAVLKTHEGKLVNNCISPRAFEAASCKTAMILFEGEYSGILKPWTHYLPLKKDFSNFSEIIAALKDTNAIQDMVDRTFEDLIRSHQYDSKALGKIVADALLALLPKSGSRQEKLFLPKKPFYQNLLLVGNECRLILSESVKKITDPSLSIKNRIKTLANSSKRYWVYLSPRVKKGLF